MQRNDTEAMFQSMREIPLKSMFDHPLSLARRVSIYPLNISQEGFALDRFPTSLACGNEQVGRGP